MGRVNLLLDEELLREARRILVTSDDTATVTKALEEAVRIDKIRRLHRFVGSGIWSGDLAQMREDHSSDRD